MPYTKKLTISPPKPPSEELMASPLLSHPPVKFMGCKIKSNGQHTVGACLFDVSSVFCMEDGIVSSVCNLF